MSNIYYCQKKVSVWYAQNLMCENIQRKNFKKIQKLATYIEVIQLQAKDWHFHLTFHVTHTVHINLC